MSRDSIEFYNGDANVCSVESSMVPPVGSRISIRKVEWEVVNVTYALDHADEFPLRAMRANVDLKKVRGKR